MRTRRLPPAASALAALSLAFLSCTQNETPPGPQLLFPPTVQFAQGQMITYFRENFDANNNPDAYFQDVVEVDATGLTLAGLDGVAAVRVSSGPPGGGESRADTTYCAYSGGRLLVYDPGVQAGDGYPSLPAWNVLLDLTLRAAPDTLLAFDSTFVLTMASGSLLRDHIACVVATRYVGTGQLPVFGSPIVNCFIFTRSLRYDETVDTAGVLLFQAPAISLQDSVWYADDIGPVRMSSRGSPLGIDSLGLPFSLAALRVYHTADTHRSFGVRYSRAGGVDALWLRYGLYEIPPPASTLIMAINRSY
ncbi:MAG TPA: hypothetical protein VL221_13805 [Bacteroidota bacterium]|nr:hypothetical protein [Bacteroidota bacterium]